MTHKIFKHTSFDIVIVIHENELTKYQESMGNDTKFLCHDDSVKGNMAKVRNFIVDNNGERYFIMCDDDLKKFQLIENGKQRTMTPDELENMIINGFNMCEDLGTVLWGINLLNDPMAYREYSPLSLLSVILGPFSAHIKNDLRYDDRLPLKEDYDYSLQVLQKHHKILRFNKYSYMTEHITLEGGCPSYRTKSAEIEQMKIFKKKWGERIVKGDIEKSINPVVTVPLKGI